MRTGGPHRMRNAVFAALFLLAGGALAGIYMNKSVPHDQNRDITGNGPYRVSRRVEGTPVFPSLLTRLIHREAVPLSRARNASVLKSVFEVFDPSLRSFLTSVPLVLDPSADTAKAYPAKGYIGVSPDWDNTVSQSKYRTIYEQRGMKPEAPVFMRRFKTDLLIHEFLHILQVHQRIDGRLCYEAVARWYIDPLYGIPSPGGTVYTDTTKGKRPGPLATNRMKYIVWHELYNYRRLSDVPHDESWKNMQYAERYRSAKKGVEEFAYIGQEILASGSSSENFIRTGIWCDTDWKDKRTRMREISPDVAAFFRGVFNPALMQK